MRRLSTVLGAGVAAVVLGLAGPALSQTFPRQGAPAGLVIARKSGEEARYVEVSDWRTVEVQQDLVAGDVLRTNATGHLALLFTDHTQIRLGRNTTLVVKSVGTGSGDTELELQDGELWARAERGGEGLTVDTPAAAAAIRGTDWTMRVEGDRTSLIVLEGRVDLSNELGSVSVTRGEAASARIGQAPTKTVIVDPDDREQMLYYLSLRNAFNLLPASPLPSPEMRGARLRIAAIPEERRSAEDWIVLAEAALSYDGRQAAMAASARARAMRLNPAQEARLDLIDALIAGAEGRYDEAARLFASAAPRLDPRRRAVAVYGGYFSRSLADPERAEAAPRLRDGGPYAALAEAYAAGFLQDIPAAIAVLKAAEARYPDDPTLPAARAQFALLVDDREQVKEAVDRALAIDPDDPTALEARAHYRAGLEGDVEGAYEDLSRAVQLAPGSTTIWNALGLVQSTRGASREAEAALKRSIELDPQDPLSHANLALIYLEEDRVPEAKAEIDAAMAADPTFHIGLIARGRYHLQTGELDKAVDDLLAGTTADPAFSQGLLLLGSAHYERGDREAAEQAFDNAERLDPNDPATAFLRTAIAIDEYRSDDAIAGAQEALKRTQARGGDFAALSANKDAGSTLNDAFRLQGLDAWGRYYGDAVFDPFEGSALVDRAVSGSPDPFVNDLGAGGSPVEPGLNSNGFSAFFQGLLLSPEMLSGRSRSANLFRRPFLEVAVGAGFVATDGADVGWTAQGEVQGFAASPFPMSIYGSFTGRVAEESRDGSYLRDGTTTEVSFDLADEDFSGTGYITARPTPNDRIIAYLDARADGSDIRDGVFGLDPPVFTTAIPFPTVPGVGLGLFLDQSTYDREVDDRSLTSGLAWSHTFAYRNVATVAVFGSGFDRSSAERGLLSFDGVPFDPTTGDPIIDPTTGLPFLFELDGVQTVDGEFNQQSLIGAASHLVGIDDLTLRYGIEGGSVSQERTERSFTEVLFPGEPPSTTLVSSHEEADLVAGRAYIDALYEISPALLVEAGVFGTFLQGDVEAVRDDGTGPVSEIGGIEETLFEPRLGAAWEPVAGQWLRAGFIRESGALSSTSLAPVGIVGLQSNQLPLGITGHSDTFAARWDAEWNDRFFTSLDYQHQQADELTIPVPGGITTTDLDEGRIDRFSATANYHLGGRWGLFGTAVYTDAEGESRAEGYDGPLPFVPDWSGRAGFTYVSPYNLKLTLAATYIGERAGDLAGTTLDDYWTADAFLTWEPLDKRFAIELAAYNLFDEEFEAATSTPGWGRTIMGSIKARF